MNLLSKDLKARVIVDTKKATNNIAALEKKIQKLDSMVNKMNRHTTGLSSSINRANAPTRQLAQNASQVNKNFQKTNSVVGTLTSKLKRLAATYLGVMGAKAAIQTSDVITSTENKLNNLNGGNASLTQESMDKMYASAQRVRMGYADMMANASKSITLAGDAFQDNIDNAIRFQEIMAESYALGGASDAEMSSSMYQMIQALGSGILQGDELRSVREGAPLAYKAIEEFTQGVLNSEESLKELASQGKVTSDMVVAAIMNAGDKMDEQFEKTSMTFAQAWTKIKNVAVKSFEPVLQMLNDALNSSFGQGVINGLMTGIQIVAGALRIVFNLISSIYNFVVDHWGVISKILMTIGTFIAIYLIFQLVMLLDTIKTVIYFAIVKAVTLIMEFIAMAKALGFATAMSITFGISLNTWLWILIGVLLVIIIVIMWVSDSFVDGCGKIVGAVYWVLGVIHNVIAFIINLVLALLSAIVAVATNIGIAFYNGWQNAKAYFWDFVSSVLDGCGSLLNAINAVLSAFGKETISVEWATNKANNARANKKEYLDVADVTKQAFNVVPYTNLSDMFDKGYGYGTKAGNWITDKISGLGDLLNVGADKLPNASDYDLTKSYDPTGLKDSKNLADIKDKTGSIADSMELTQDDLEYLRKIAALEWKKEFTTANISVDMKNYNTMNGETDLDGIVTKLVDKLYDELDAVADGVYA